MTSKPWNRVSLPINSTSGDELRPLEELRSGVTIPAGALVLPEQVERCIGVRGVLLAPPTILRDDPV